MDHVSSPEYILDAMEVLKTEIEGREEDSLPIHAAIVILDEKKEAEHDPLSSMCEPRELIGRLLDRGYLYEVEGEVKIT